MKRVAGAVVAAALAWASAASAQNLVITNARILDGAGGVIPRGVVVIQGGRIVSAGAGSAAPPAGAQTLDARGMTVMPGFIETHRHLIRGPAQDWLRTEAQPRMREFLEAGFTTVYSMGDDPVGILELRRRLKDGEIAGPRLFAAARVPVARAAPAPAAAGPPVDAARRGGWKPPLRTTVTAVGIPEAESRAAVQAAKRAGFDAIKTILLVTPNGPETETLRVIADEARKQGLLSVTHATTVQDTLAAVAARTDVLAHTPHTGRLDEDPAAVQTIVRANIPMMSTLGVFVPRFTAAPEPIFRDDGPFPFEHLSSGGQGPVNARLLANAGITYGYGTDTTWLPRDSLAQELKPLGLMFSPKEVVGIMTAKAAQVIHKDAELGSLQPGKLGDVVILGGDPLADIGALLDVKVVVKEGRVVVDRR